MSDLHIGVTASRFPLSARAKVSLHLELFTIQDNHRFSTSPIHLHHGDCINGDIEAAKMSYALGYVVHAHPPFDEKLRAFTEFSHIIHPPQAYLDRNLAIVDASSILIAVPTTYNEVLRSGTWATIRYARLLRKEIYIIFPDGSVKRENNERTDGCETPGT